MKGQTQAVTAVMLTGVIVGSIGTVYYWGTPLLEKRQAQSDVQQMENEIESLYGEIVSVSNKGSGTSSRITIEADEEVTLNTEEDYIQISTEPEISVKQGFTWTLLKGSSLQNISIGAGDYGIKGEDLPGVIAVKSDGGDNALITYRIEFRNLCSSSSQPELTKIDLQADGKTRAVGSTTVVLNNEGSQVDRDLTMPEGECEGSVDRRRNVVNVQFE